jgi:hypothetical protein
MAELDGATLGEGKAEEVGEDAVEGVAVAAACKEACSGKKV